jgi:hypothetical protein
MKPAFSLARMSWISLKGAVPDVVIVFASSAYSYEALLTAIDETCGPA